MQEKQKRVWKPLDVGGLRLYRVHSYWPDLVGAKTDYVVAATSPRNAVELVRSTVYPGRTDGEMPTLSGHPLTVLMPESWWIDGVPCEPPA